MQWCRLLVVLSGVCLGVPAFAAQSLEAQAALDHAMSEGARHQETQQHAAATAATAKATDKTAPTKSAKKKSARKKEAPPKGRWGQPFCNTQKAKPCGNQCIPKKAKCSPTSAR